MGLKGTRDDAEGIRSRAWAREPWEAWYRSMIGCRLAPVKKVARMIKRHLDGILTAVVDRVTNARAESTNAGIQEVKYSARGFRNRARFRNANTFTSAALISIPPASPRGPLSSTRIPEAADEQAGLRERS